MLAHRKKRLILVLFLVSGGFLTLALVLAALDNNLDFFYSPEAILSGEAPTGHRIRAGGLVKENSLVKQGLGVSFVITDLRDHEVEIKFEGILPDLFREGQGIVAIGTLSQQLVFTATEVLAKHDENYMSPEVATVIAGEQAQLEPASEIPE